MYHLHTITGKASVHPTAFNSITHTQACLFALLLTGLKEETAEPGTLLLRIAKPSTSQLSLRPAHAPACSTGMRLPPTSKHPLNCACSMPMENTPLYGTGSVPAVQLCTQHAYGEYPCERNWVSASRSIVHAACLWRTPVCTELVQCQPEVLTPAISSLRISYADAKRVRHQSRMVLNITSPENAESVQDPIPSKRSGPISVRRDLRYQHKTYSGVQRDSFALLHACT